MKSGIYTCLLSISLIANACFTIKPAATKTGKNLWEEFYVAQGVIQYFIKPLTFKSNSGDIIVDFTFRTNSDSATVNFNIIDTNPIAIPTQVSFFKDEHLCTISSRKTLLSEKKNKTFKLRQTGKIAQNDLIRLFGSNNCIISVTNNSATKDYQPAKRTEKYVVRLKSNLFDVIYPDLPQQ